MSQLTIIRPKENLYSEGKLKIEVDGKVMARISQGEQIVLEIPNGVHTIRAITILGMGSKKLLLNVDNESKIEVAVNYNFNFSPYVAVTLIPLFFIWYFSLESFWLKTVLVVAGISIIFFFVRMLIKGKSEAVLVHETVES